MTIDTSKHKYAHFSFTDIGLHCVCGHLIRVGDVGDEGTELVETCPDCGQKWSVRVLIYPVLEFPHLDYSSKK